MGRHPALGGSHRSDQVHGATLQRGSGEGGERDRAGLRDRYPWDVLSLDGRKGAPDRADGPRSSSQHQPRECLPGRQVRPSTPGRAPGREGLKRVAAARAAGSARRRCRGSGSWREGSRRSRVRSTLCSAATASSSRCTATRGGSSPRRSTPCSSTSAPRRPSRTAPPRAVARTPPQGRARCPVRSWLCSGATATRSTVAPAPAPRLPRAAAARARARAEAAAGRAGERFHCVLPGTDAAAGGGGGGGAHRGEQQLQGRAHRHLRNVAPPRLARPRQRPPARRARSTSLYETC